MREIHDFKGLGRLVLDYAEESTVLRFEEFFRDEPGILLFQVKKALKIALYQEAEVWDLTSSAPPNWEVYIGAPSSCVILGLKSGVPGIIAMEPPKNQRFVSDLLHEIGHARDFSHGLYDIEEFNAYCLSMREGRNTLQGAQYLLHSECSAWEFVFQFLSRMKPARVVLQDFYLRARCTTVSYLHSFCEGLTIEEKEQLCADYEKWIAVNILKTARLK